MKNVISIDGGGIRGIVPAYLLMLIEEKMQSHLFQHVDLVAGTSTGAIIAGGIASGMPMESILKLYFQSGPDIFKKTFRTQMESVFGLRGGKHDVENFIKVLEKHYGTGNLDTLKTDFLCTAYCMTDGAPKFFSKKGEGNLPISRVIATSAAAPTYFDPVLLDGKEYIDGGVFAGNPAMVAFAEIKDMYDVPAEDIQMFSFGTGNRLQAYSTATNWFKFKWITPLLDIMMAADGGVIHYELLKIYHSVEKLENYYRLTGKITDADDISTDMGKATQENMNKILDFAKKIGAKNEKMISEIAEKLLGHVTVSH